ncbi:MAG: TrpR-like protein, YerC/YecD [Clostridia bacterium]|nr:TrpR-like protein, YerC/YecD [Clostridia bacterium]
MSSNEKKEFFEAILLLQSVEECEKFFEDTCTVKEVVEMSQRLKVAKMLNEGKSYLEVVKATGCSSATISRVSKCLQSDNGYRMIINRLKEQD